MTLARPLAPTPPPARRVAGMHTYRPHAGQAQFHNDRYRIKYRGAFAGTGGGKTYAAAFEAISWMWENPGCVGGISEPDLKMVGKILVDDTLPALIGPLTNSPFVAEWHETKHRLRLHVPGHPGIVSTAYLVGLEEPDKAEGANLHWWWADEVRIVRRWREAWHIIRRRLRAPGHRVGAWVTSHSPRKIHADFFEGPDKDPDARVYRWSTEANRDNLAPGYVDDVIRSHHGAAYDAVVLGKVARPEGLCYTLFEPGQHIRPPPARGQYDRMSYGVDWGWSDPACILAITWRGNVAHVVEEIYGAHIKPSELAQRAADMRRRWGAGPFWCGADRPEHIREFVEAGLEAYPIRGKPEEAIPLLQDRFAGGELLIAPTCRNLLAALDEYSYPPGGGEKPEHEASHAPDAMRYGVLGGGAERGGTW